MPWDWFLKGSDMATKVELQAAYERCEQIHHGVAAELHKPDFPAAVKQGETALSHQHAAVTFQRRFQNMACMNFPGRVCSRRSR